MTYDDFDTQVQCEELLDLSPTDDDYMEDGIDTILDDTQDGVVIDDEDEDWWFTSDGGLTADAQVYLHELDEEGEFV